MAVKRKRKLNKSVISIAILSCLVITGFLLIFSNPSFWFKKSIHDDARSYSTKHCLVFYPNSKFGKKYAKEICSKVTEDRIYDYSLVPYGDYYFVNYGNGLGYFIDSNNDPIVFDDISEDGKKIVADYLRYTIKKEQPDKYYNADFLASTTVDNLDFSEVQYNIDGHNLKCSFPTYELDVLVPLKYIQNEIGMDFGYENELYSKPVYIDDKHKIICLTFDDGPQFMDSPSESSSTSIVNTLYKYDANATFYICDYILQMRDKWSLDEAKDFLTRSINNGNEYGSHTDYHDDLNDFDTAQEIRESILSPARTLKELTGYDMVTYRPPGGLFDEIVLAVQPYPAIYWNVDSEDWQANDFEEIHKNVMTSDLDDGDIIIFHDIYDDTAKAIEKIVPELINKGYQLVTVKDMLAYEGINVNTLKYYYNLNPWPYYE